MTIAKMGDDIRKTVVVPAKAGPSGVQPTTPGSRLRGNDGKIVIYFGNPQ